MSSIVKNNNEFASSGTIASITPLENKAGLFSCFPFDLFSSTPTVAILRLQGVIGKIGMRDGLTLNSLNESIEKAFKISKLAAICLVINSPGGSPVQSELIAKRIIDLSEEKEIPIYSFVEDVAASGGYWLACAGSEIYVSRSSIIGSIGVVSSGFGFQGALAKLGIERRVYSQGNNKSVLDPFEEAKASDIKIVKGIQKKIHDHFIDAVKSRRKGKLTQSDDILFNGEFWAGESAVDFGLVDGIDDVYSFIKNKFGDKVKIENITAKQSWFKKKLGIEGQIDQVVEGVLSKVEERLAAQRFGLF